MTPTVNILHSYLIINDFLLLNNVEKPTSTLLIPSFVSTLFGHIYILVHGIIFISCHTNQYWSRYSDHCLHCACHRLLYIFNVIFYMPIYIYTSMFNPYKYILSYNKYSSRPLRPPHTHNMIAYHTVIYSYSIYSHTHISVYIHIYTQIYVGSWHNPGPFYVTVHTYQWEILTIESATTDRSILRPQH